MSYNTCHIIKLFAYIYLHIYKPMLPWGNQGFLKKWPPSGPAVWSALADIYEQRVLLLRLVEVPGICEIKTFEVWNKTFF